jgi:hypothetical protein
VQKGAFSASLMFIGHALLGAALLFGFAFGLQHSLRLPTVTLVLAIVDGAVLPWMGYGLVRTPFAARLPPIWGALGAPRFPATHWRCRPGIRGPITLAAVLRSEGGLVAVRVWRVRPGPGHGYANGSTVTSTLAQAS